MEVGGAQVPVTWEHKPNLDSADPRKVVIVYESNVPHLRASWNWQARAGFGPIEHSIKVENLGEGKCGCP